MIAPTENHPGWAGFLHLVAGNLGGFFGQDEQDLQDEEEEGGNGGVEGRYFRSLLSRTNLL